MADGSDDLIADRYKLISPVGKGNMSTVYRGEDTRRGNRTVAVKVLNTIHEDVLKQELFRRETKALETLEHPNIVTISDHGWSTKQKCYYIVLEYIPRTLIDEVSSHKDTEDISWCWPLLRSLAHAITHAHSQGVIHRDIKPTNILITETGSPILTDFGISRLKYELGTGVTVSSFFSIGYAAPEQRIYQQATEKSDLYSLGYVFYFILSKQEPPTDGLTSQHIQSLQVPQPLKHILQRMTKQEAEDRLDATLLLRQLDQLQGRFTPLSDVYFLVTDNARKDLYNLGYTKRSSIQEACEFLKEELGGEIPKDADFTLVNSDISVLTDNLRLLCSKDDKYPLLIIKAAHQPYEPKLEAQKQNAKPLRYTWKFIDRNASYTLTSNQNELINTLNTLMEQLSTHQQIQQVTRERRAERRDFTKAWDAVLSHQKNQYNSAPKLPYKKWHRDGNNIIFTLHEAAPDDLSWPDSAPIAFIMAGHRQSSTLVGHLIGIDGTEVQVAWVPTTIQAKKNQAGELPKTGLIGLYQQEALVSLDRQHWALRALVNGATANPVLADVLLDLSKAEFEEPDDKIEFYQPDLAEDKQKAVKQALAARDIFLLQGPPGTGKTTTLAEIILQILKIKPDAKILVSSQSNVAVNHILSYVSRLRAGQHTEIVRIGRTEKIGQGAEEWALEQRLDSWRNEVLERTDDVIKELKSQTKQQQRARKLAQSLSSETLSDLEQCQTELENLESDFQELVEYKSQQAQLLERLSFEKRNRSSHAQETEQELHTCNTHIQNQTESIGSSLELIRSYIPDEMQPAQQPSIEKEKEHLTQAITHILEPDNSDNREEKLIKLIKSWQKIFGKHDDFAQPILERANIFAATCLITGGRYLKNLMFDWAIIDEAGRATAPELLVPLVRSRRSIIVGDERQLPPMLDENLDEKELTRLQVTKETLEESLFATLTAQGRDELLPAVQMLTVQHRMHPAIGRLISTVFYENKLEHGVNVSARNHGLSWFKESVVWYSTTRIPKHQEREHARSFYNRVEVQCIHKLLLKLENSYREKDETRDVAVITPYNAQISELRAQVTPDSAFWQALNIEIATVDAFQGRDCDIVLYSTVRSNDEKRLGFLKDRRRLNVALSRARQLLIIVGDIWTLENGRASDDGNPYQELVRYIRNNPQDCLIENLTMEEAHE